MSGIPSGTPFFILACYSRASGGSCAQIGTECWCFAGFGTSGSSVCGYENGYSQYYPSLTIDSVHSPWTIIKAVGQKPDPWNCKYDSREACTSDCSTNSCTTYGCIGSSLSCGDNKRRWAEAVFGSIVRCTNMEGK